MKYLVTFPTPGSSKIRRIFYFSSQVQESSIIISCRKIIKNQKHSIKSVLFFTLSVRSIFTPFHVKINILNLKSFCTLPIARLAALLFVNSSNAAFYANATECIVEGIVRHKILDLNGRGMGKKI